MLDKVAKGGMHVDTELLRQIRSEFADCDQTDFIDAQKSMSEFREGMDFALQKLTHLLATMISKMLPLTGSTSLATEEGLTDPYHLFLLMKDAKAAVASCGSNNPLWIRCFNV
jgi:hypothetical protein